MPLDECHNPPFRDVIITNADTLAARNEQKMLRLEQITRAGYQDKVQWECEFDDDDIATTEWLAHPTMCKSHLSNRDALYGVRTEAMLLQYKAREGEIIQYVDVMSLYPYICKYFKYPVGNPVIHCGRTLQRQGNLFVQGGPYKMFYRSYREVVSSRAPLLSQSDFMFSLCRYVSQPRIQEIAVIRQTKRGL